MKRFDRLLQVMATQPEPSGKPAKDNQTSGKALGASYGDTRTRAGKSAGASAEAFPGNRGRPARMKLKSTFVVRSRRVLSAIPPFGRCPQSDEIAPASAWLKAAQLM